MGRVHRSANNTAPLLPRFPPRGGTVRPPETPAQQMVNEAEFAAMKAAKKAAKAAKAAGTAGEAKKQQRKEERKKRKAGESSAAAASSGTAAAPTGDGSAPADDSTSAAYAVVNAAASRGPLQDQTVCCIDCGNDFVFSVEEHGHSGPWAARQHSPCAHPHGVPSSWPWAARHSQGEAGPLGAQPPTATAASR